MTMVQTKRASAVTGAGAKRWSSASVERLFLIVVLSILLSACGCSAQQEGPQRVAVEGEVRFHDQPLENGAIFFIPTGQTKGPRAGAIIKAGQYRLPTHRGPVIGTLRVEIRSAPALGYDITEPTETVQHIGQPLPEDNIPAQYNDRSTLVVETTADGPNAFSFHLP